jgi:RNA polymerase sigma factor (sigma-70 family)
MVDVTALYLQHGAMVFRRARRLLRDEDAARDIVHDVFVTLHERRGDIQRSGMVSWLYVVATNLCLKRLRSMATRTRLAGAIDRATYVPARGEDVAELRALLSSLPEELAAVAVYRFVDEMTHAEIATVMGCSRRHVGDLLTRLERRIEPVRAQS